MNSLEDFDKLIASQEEKLKLAEQKAEEQLKKAEQEFVNIAEKFDEPEVP